jgi:hypothetical protein
MSLQQLLLLITCSPLCISHPVTIQHGVTSHVNTPSLYTSSFSSSISSPYSKTVSQRWLSSVFQFSPVHSAQTSSHNFTKTVLSRTIY